MHDLRFVAAKTIKDTYPQLLAECWGTPGTLHVDCWAEIASADGYDVSLRIGPVPGAEKLCVVNLDGYDPADFAEQHKNMFVVAASTKEAKTRALSTISGWKEAHKDGLYEAEKAFALSRVGERLYIHLTPGENSRQPLFTCKYVSLK